MMKRESSPPVNNTPQAAPATPAIETVIGAGTVFEGTFSGESSLRIEGTVNGDINSGNTVIVGEKGVISGSVHARQVFVAGRIEGDVIATDCTEFVASGLLHGDLTTNTLIIEKGASIDGRCKTNSTVPSKDISPVKMQAGAGGDN